MKRPIFFIFSLSFLSGSYFLATAQESKPVTDSASSEAIAQPAEPSENANEKKQFDFSKENQLELFGHDKAVSIIDTHGSDLLVLNFWATWCGPCVKELPYFQELQELYDEKEVRVVGYSLDYDTNPDDFKETSQRTLDARGVKFANYVLNVDSYETFPVFSENWQGNLPATFIFDSEGNLVAEVLKAIEREDLFTLVEKLKLRSADKIFPSP